MPIALPLAEAAAGLAGILLIAAAFAIALLVADMLGGLPLIGGRISSGARNAMLWAISRTVVWSHESAAAVATAIAHPVLSIWTMIDALVTEDWQIVGAVHTLASYTLPNLRGWVWALVDANTRWLFATITADVEWLKQYIYDSTQWVLSWAQAAIAAERAYTDYVKLSLWEAITAWVSILVRRMDAGDVEASKYAEALTGRAIDYADGIGARDLRVIDEVARQLAARMGLEVNRAIDYERAVAGELLRDIAGAEARANTYAAALAVPIAAAVTALEDLPCIRACGPLGDLGGLLQGLEEAGLLALLLALVQDARSHPQDVERMLSAVFSEPLKDVAQSFQLGIAG